MLKKVISGLTSLAMIFLLAFAFTGLWADGPDHVNLNGPPILGNVATWENATGVYDTIACHELAVVSKSQLEKDFEEGRVWNYPRVDTIAAYMGFRLDTAQSDAAYKETITWIDGAAASGVIKLYAVSDLDVSAASQLTETAVTWVNPTAWNIDGSDSSAYLEMFTVTSLVTDVTDDSDGHLIWAGDLSRKGRIIEPIYVGADNTTTTYYFTLPEINPRTVNITTTTRPRP